MPSAEGLKKIKIKYWSYHVWLRGSQFSLPTFSMQNFCGPLLPVFIRHQIIKNTNRMLYFTRKVQHNVWENVSFNFVYPSNQQTPPQEDDRFLWQTAGVSFFFHCPFLSQTANRTSVIISKTLSNTVIFPF